MDLDRSDISKTAQTLVKYKDMVCTVMKKPGNIWKLKKVLEKRNPSIFSMSVLQGFF